MDTVIRRLRMQLGEKAAAIARAADLYPTDLSRLETGSGKAGPKVQERLASALGVDSSTLFDERGWPIQDEG